MKLVAGVDGCKSGWVVVAWYPEGATDIKYLRFIDDFAEAFPGVAAVAIDIPIGLPTTGHRAADEAARTFVGRRRNSVFYTPIREVLEADSYAIANARCKEITDRGVPRQAYGLNTKIFEVEGWLASAPCPTWEVHPEVSFTMLLGHPASAGKKTWVGVRERHEALAAAGLPLDNVPEEVGKKAAVDDILDAAVAAWTARRLSNGEAVPIPNPPELDASGRPIAIWA